MGKLVMLDVFSGRPNPVWEVSEDEGRGMIAEAAKAGAEVDVPLLGYRGFKLLDSADADHDVAMLSEGKRTEANVASTLIGDRDAEHYLLEAGLRSGAIDDEIARHVRERITSVDLRRVLLEGAKSVATTCPPCGGGAAPPYDPNYWNSDQTRLRNNNCYNYANNKATNTFAQPGRASGATAASMSCAQVRPAAERDGLVRVPTYQASIPGLWYVALVVWPNYDYHWYRQDNVGCWSHKPGQTPAKNVDNSNRRISDPASCDRGPYSDFCCYMTTKPNANIR